MNKYCNIGMFVQLWNILVSTLSVTKHSLYLNYVQNLCKTPIDSTNSQEAQRKYLIVTNVVFNYKILYKGNSEKLHSNHLLCGC